MSPAGFLHASGRKTTSRTSLNSQEVMYSRSRIPIANYRQKTLHYQSPPYSNGKSDQRSKSQSVPTTSIIPHGPNSEESEPMRKHLQIHSSSVHKRQKQLSKLESIIKSKKDPQTPTDIMVG